MKLQWRNAWQIFVFMYTCMHVPLNQVIKAEAIGGVYKIAEYGLSTLNFLTTPATCQYYLGV